MSAGGLAFRGYPDRHWILALSIALALSTPAKATSSADVHALVIEQLGESG